MSATPLEEKKVQQPPPMSAEVPVANIPAPIAKQPKSRAKKKDSAQPVVVITAPAAETSPVAETPKKEPEQQKDEEVVRIDTSSGTAAMEDATVDNLYQAQQQPPRVAEQRTQFPQTRSIHASITKAQNIIRQMQARRMNLEAGRIKRLEAQPKVSSAAATTRQATAAKEAETKVSQDSKEIARPTQQQQINVLQQRIQERVQQAQSQLVGSRLRWPANRQQGGGGNSGLSTKPAFLPNSRFV